MSSAPAAASPSPDTRLLDQYDPARYPPYVAIPGITQRTLADVPNVGLFTVPAPGEKVIKSYRIRVRRPKFPWVAFAISIPLSFMLFAVPTLLVVLGFFLFRKRGHTFLYVTTQRVVVVELTQGLFGKGQTVLSYTIDNIAGFTLHAQRGLKKFLSLILLKEKRTFYISIINKSWATFQTGAINTRGSMFDPGQDAVTLCAELDATVLALKGRK